MKTAVLVKVTVSSTKRYFKFKQSYTSKEKLYKTFKSQMAISNMSFVLKWRDNKS